MRQILIGVVLVCAAQAQLARVGEIHFYGLRKFTPEEILRAARLAPGDSIAASRTELESRITELPDVMAANVQTICCEGDRATLFIGILERGAAQPSFRPAPGGAVSSLPDDLMASYRAYEGALMRAEITGAPLGVNPETHRAQTRFQTYAAAHTAKLHQELRANPYPEQRAAAAIAIRYSPNKIEAVDDLVFALQDPDETVRANAARSIASIATGIRIPPARLVDLLDSVVLSDRQEATKALLALTERQNAATLDLLRKQALPALAEMARWNSYGLPPFRLLGRAAGMTDFEVNQAWATGDRGQAIQRALDSAAGK